MNEELKKCRVCGTPTEGWALETLPGYHPNNPVPAQSWCPTHCIEEFEEHDWFLEDGMRYCKHCGTAENPEDTAEYLSDLAAGYYDN